jgi:transposase-like protein
MDEHLGYKKNDNAGDHSGDSRNGRTNRTVYLENGTAEVDAPCDRNGSFESGLLPKEVRRAPIFNDQIIALYGKGMTTRQIADFPRALYGVEVSAELISTVTDTVNEDVKEWRLRQLEARYAVVIWMPSA